MSLLRSPPHFKRSATIHTLNTIEVPLQIPGALLPELLPAAGRFLGLGHWSGTADAARAARADSPGHGSPLQDSSGTGPSGGEASGFTATQRLGLLNTAASQTPPFAAQRVKPLVLAGCEGDPDGGYRSLAVGTLLFCHTGFCSTPRRAANSAQLQPRTLGFLAVQINSHPAGKLQIKSTAGGRWKPPARPSAFIRRTLNIPALGLQLHRGNLQAQCGTELSPSTRVPQPADPPAEHTAWAGAVRGCRCPSTGATLSPAPVWALTGTPLWVLHPEPCQGYSCTCAHLQVCAYVRACMYRNIYRHVHTHTHTCTKTIVRDEKNLLHAACITGLTGCWWLRCPPGKDCPQRSTGS